VEVNGLENLEKVESEEAGLLGEENLDSTAAIGFLEAWRLPGVAPFAFCLFFSKLVAYTFLYWLPFYISHTGICFFLTLKFISRAGLPHANHLCMHLDMSVI
jgi:OPA family glycerol-3-phosphate transporter-like MFS transporter 1/2